MWYRIRAAKVDCRAAEAVLAAADVERTSREVRILKTPVIPVTLRFTFTVACAFGATENGSETAGTSAGVVADGTG